ncbi:hypothetical protein JJV70_14805 [Streptomyces sp. JJ66]|uniref:hypothetical protein n=1 Tax=Streptomyces sp. JJ66 TaxID=2803843 RepID=UPI001C5A0AAD|nr:hypothetical protein [Streptomyces sp. JJ66]MBW1603347.1 hypothetical protein [Streptomyces sp. JJ66]
MDRRKATAAGLAALVLTAVGGTGCTRRTVAVAEPPDAQDARDGDARQRVRGAADALVRAGSSDVRTGMELLSGGTRLTIRGVGVFDYARRRGLLEVSLPDGRERPVTQVIAPGSLFMKHRGAGVPADKWVEVDPRRLADGNLVTNGATDPLTAAALLRGATSVRYAGAGEARGEPVRRYTGTTDAAAAARAATDGVRAQLAAAAKGFSSGAVPFEVWLDGRGLPRLLRYTFAFADSTGAGRGTGEGPEEGSGEGSGESAAEEPVEVVSTNELHGFGRRVAVRLPPPAEVYRGTIAVPGQRP